MSTFQLIKNTLFAFLLFSFYSCSEETTSPPVITTAPVTQDKQVYVETEEEKQQKLEALWLQNYTIEQKIGQLIMVGLNDRTTLTSNDSLTFDLKSNKIGGIILFEKNINKTSSNAPADLKALVDSCQKYATTSLFVAIDEEGGKVHRLKEKYGFVSFPSAAYLGSKGDTDTMYYYASRMAKQLKDLGINVNFAPCVDVAVNPENPIIAKVLRSYSANEDTVAMFAMAFVKAHKEQQVITTLKHFPGHGSSTNDSHKGVADVTKTWIPSELKPYQVLFDKKISDAILSCHVTNCKLDPNCIPATLSPLITQQLLRDSLGFKGVVFSDDMQMYAISKAYGFKESLAMAINAGVDVLVFGNNVNVSDRMSAKQLHQTLMSLYKEGKISEARINEAFLRIMRLKKMYGLVQ
ncbi:MAG: glycoside hydrolase family 3 protein [Cytophagaceae bacterium]